ncbi:MAG: WD40 repeat domain-containing protein [Planctomycetes bacterium]|nr:WD40 repeat domain-containing protein [Planctomycetota bacterium]
MLRSCACLYLLTVVAASCPLHAVFDDKSALEAQRIAALVKKLGSKQFIERDAAERDLTAAGEAALEALRGAAAGPDLEVTRRAHRIIQAIDKAPCCHVRMFDNPRPSNMYRLKRARFEVPVRGTKDPMSWPTKVAVTPDGRQLLSAAPDGLRLWDIATGKLNLVFAEHDWVPAEWSLAMSRDGSRALTGLQFGAVQLWELKSGKLLQGFYGHEGAVSGVAMFPDGRRVISAGLDKTIRIWDVETRQEVRRFAAGAGVHALALSPDAKLFAACLSGDGKQPGVVKVWEVERGAEHLTLPGQDVTFRSIAFSADGKSLLSTGSDEAVRLWKLTTGKEQLRFKAHEGGVAWAGFTPDGRRIVTAGSDLNPVVRVWDAITGKQVRCSQRCFTGIASVAVLADGRHAVTAERDGTLQLWGWK